MTIYEGICSKCGKKIESLNKNQLEHNLKVHEMTCKAKK